MGAPQGMCHNLLRIPIQFKRVNAASVLLNRFLPKDKLSSGIQWYIATKDIVREAVFIMKEVKY